MNDYQIIYADPPWRYQDKGSNGAAEAQYQTMPLDDIKALPVESIATQDAVLFLWATYPLYPEALEVIAAWGFKYKTMAFQWVKLNRNNWGAFFGLGRWTRGNTEPCLLATRGKPHRVRSDVFQLLMSPIQGHSHKPPEIRERIVQLMGDLPRIELFARRKVDGWDAWGNEVKCDVEMPTDG